MGLPVWFKEQWRKLTEETIPAIQSADADLAAEVAALRARVDELEQQRRYGAYETRGY